MAGKKSVMRSTKNKKEPTETPLAHQVIREQYAYILDVLVNGYPEDTRPIHLKNLLHRRLG
jgi:predicted nucleic acid-binding OB-fold protein